VSREARMTPWLAARRRVLLAGLGWLCSQSAPAAADGELAVVTRADTALGALDRQTVANLYLGRAELRLPQGERLVALDQRDPALRERFYRAVSGLSAARVKAYWAQRVFAASGRPPPELSLEQALAQTLEAPGRMTYLPAADVPAGFKVLLTVAEP